jgi:hypothetical protein
MPTLKPNPIRNPRTLNSNPDLRRPNSNLGIFRSGVTSLLPSRHLELAVQTLTPTPTPTPTLTLNLILTLTLTQNPYLNFKP